MLKYAFSTPKINLNFRQTTTTPIGKLPFGGTGYSTVTSTQRSFTSRNYIESPKIIVEINDSDGDNDNDSLSEGEEELSSVADTRNNAILESEWNPTGTSFQSYAYCKKYMELDVIKFHLGYKSRGRSVAADAVFTHDYYLYECKSHQNCRHRVRNFLYITFN